MARGYPDFSGATAFPVRKHCRAQNSLVGVIAAGITAAAYNIAGQAVIDGGYLSFTTVGMPSDINLAVEIDDQWIGWVNTGAALLFRLSGPVNFPFHITYFNADPLTVTVQIVADYYCGYEYVFWVKNGTGNNLFLSGDIWYSDVT